MLIDSHAHLAHPFYKNSLAEIIKSAKDNKVEKIVTIGCTIDEAKKSIEIANQFEGVYATAGLYPKDHKGDEGADLPLEEKLKIIEELAKDPKVVAIGECGLDYSRPYEDEIDPGKTGQFERFERQIELAKSLERPFIIHSRESTEDTLALLASNSKTHYGVWHCFSENIKIATEALDLGLNISLTGNITYKKNEELRKAVKMIPLDKIMLETDSPYLTPQKARDQKTKRNSPQYVKMIAEEIAEIKGISYEEVAQTTTANAIKFFKIP